MSQQVTFATAAKGAFRVTIQGTQPHQVTSLLLTGHGDERDLALDVGNYTADIVNIGNGEHYKYSFAVDASADNRVHSVGRDGDSHVAWRSLAVKGRSLSVRSGNTQFKQDAEDLQPSSAKLRMRAKVGADWRAFSGTKLASPDHPGTFKIVRSGTWSECPIVRFEFTDHLRKAVHCYIPLFSGGTLLEWREADGHLLSIGPHEPKSEAVVGSLSNSLRAEVPDIVRWASGGGEAEAVRAIMQSREDPWAAAAAGLLLVGAGRSRHLGPYVARLAQRHAWLADAGVLAAWWLAASVPSEEKACLDLLMGARERGQIYYWNSFSLSEQLLTALGSGGGSTNLRTSARKELGRWKRLRDGAVKVGAFPLWVTKISKAAASLDAK